MTVQTPLADVLLRNLRDLRDLRVGDQVEIVLGESAAEDEAERATLQGYVWQSGNNLCVGPFVIRHVDAPETPHSWVRSVKVLRPAWWDAPVIRATIVNRGDADIRNVLLLRGLGADGAPAWARVVERDGLAPVVAWHEAADLADVEVPVR